MPGKKVKSRFLFAAIAGQLLLALTMSAHADTLSVGGSDRSYTIFRPAHLSNDGPVPLVIVLHGGFGNGAQAEKSYHWDEMAQKKGFVVAYPDGNRRSWNAGGGCCGPAFRNNVDDVAFLSALISVVSRNEYIDPKRIYLTGISNGTAMSYRYACEGLYPVAAIGAVSGTMSQVCPNPKPVSVIAIHGLLDQNIPFVGGQGSKGVTEIDWPSVEGTLSRFRQADQCPAPPIESHNGSLTTYQSNCAQGREVTLITIADAGHQWPGAERSQKLAALLLDLDPPSTAMDATEKVWNFFQDHPAP